MQGRRDRHAGEGEHALPAAHAAFVYVCEGAAEVGAGSDARTARAKELAVLGTGDTVAVSAPEGARVLVVAGRPLREPVVRYGPFVMNTEEEIHQAIDDFNAGRLSQPRGAAPTAGTPPYRGA